MAENPADDATSRFISMVDVLNRAHLGESTSIVPDVDREVKLIIVTARAGISWVAFS